MSRMKRVFSSSSQVIHLWANQSQDDARSKNVFFRGTEIFSYGHHYKLGDIREINGHQVFLVNDTGYSVTTSKHIRDAWLACVDSLRLKVKSDFNIEKGLLTWQDDLINSVMSNFNRRKFYYGITEGHDPYFFQYTGQEIREFNNTATKLGFEHLVIDFNTDLRDLIKEHIVLCRDKEYVLNSPENQEKKRLEKLKKAQKFIESWRQGGPLVDSLRNLRPMLLRIKNDEVQTSGGASVPLTDALRLFNLVKSGQAKSGEKVGHFTYNSENEGLVKIGCHTIALTEAETVLKQYKPELEVIA